MVARAAERRRGGHGNSKQIPITGLGKREKAAFQRRLLAWFAANKRAMPWRGTRDAFRIWLAEVMLQQTRVAAVVPYYERFVGRFPSLEKLAQARVNEVLKYWAGLGYYSRARNLHKAAQQMVKRHDGKFPGELGAALELAGIGRYTAAAVLSIAYGKPLAVLDGNVARVLARLFAVRGNVRESKRWKTLEATAQDLLFAKAAGNWNQAMMELGAAVCTPRAPRCGECPVGKWCRAKALGIAEELPERRKRKAAVKVRLRAAVVVDVNGRTLLVRESEGEVAALFSRMWQFPAVVAPNGRNGKLAGKTPGNLIVNGVRLEGKVLPEVKHAVTFREVAITPVLVRVARLPKMEGSRAPQLSDVNRLVVSNATRKIAHEAIKALRSGPAEK